MQDVLQDIWIITKSGTVVWSRVFNPKINEQLFGALMSAIMTFSKEISQKGGLTEVQLTDKTFIFLKKKGLIFITNAPKKVKEKRIKSELQRISDIFFSLYSFQLEDWDSDISAFEDFKDHIEGSLESTIDKFKQGFW
jgi:hypothetical protein